MQNGLFQLRVEISTLVVLVTFQHFKLIGLVRVESSFHRQTGVVLVTVNWKFHPTTTV